jgi:hypothetical protein
MNDGLMAFRVKNIHVVISGLCAIAGVLIAAIQTFGGVDSNPVEVKVELRTPGAPAESESAATVNGNGKRNGTLELGRNSTEVTPSEPSGFVVASLDRAKFLPATRQDTAQKFPLPVLFDGNPSTYIKLQDPDNDIDFILEFPFTSPLVITGMEIDAGDADAVAPVKLEVMIIPSGTMEGGGRPVTSFDLRPGGGPQKFSLPPVEGKGAWIRIAGRPGAAETIIGDLKLLSAAK